MPTYQTNKKSTCTAHASVEDGYEAGIGVLIVDKERRVERRFNSKNVWNSKPETSTSQSNNVSYKSDNESSNSSFNKRVSALYSDLYQEFKVDEGYQADVE